MPRAKKSGPATNVRKKKILKLAEGFWGGRSKLYRKAKDAVAKALVYAYRDRKNRKREFRSLWITRINAAVRSEGLTYNKFIFGLKNANVSLDRKVLADIAVTDSASFKKLLTIAKEHI